MRGGERVLEELCELYPQADIFTHVVDRARLSETLKARNIETSFIAKMPMAKKHYQKYLGFMPRALEQLDLTNYDLVISSESGPAKGIIPAPGARHVCYCHSPMRYIWDHYHDYSDNLGGLARAVFARVAHKLRAWDVTSAARVDRFVANSNFVAQRIERYYRRDADVVPPPADLAAFAPVAQPGADYLHVGELVRYKRVDLAVEAFRGLDATLVVAGDGEERKALEKAAPRNVRFVGRVSHERLVELYANCRALIFPGEEDFGIVPVEAMASGRPVIAYGSGGALDTVKPGLSGVHFKEQTPEALRAAIADFERDAARYDPQAIVAHAQTFSREAFRRRFTAIVDEVMAERDAASGRVGEPVEA